MAAGWRSLLAYWLGGAWSPSTGIVVVLRPTPPGRTYTPRAESRTRTCAVECRTFTPDAERRIWTAV